MKTSTNEQGTAASAPRKEAQPTPNSKTILVCHPGGRWDMEERP